MALGGALAMSTPLPDTPAGDQAGWVLSRLGHTLEDREIEDHFAPSFLKLVPPPDVRAVTLSLKSLLPLTVTAMEGRDHTLKLALDCAQGPMTLEISVGVEGPHLINGLLIRPAGPTVHDTLREATPRLDLVGLVDERLATFARSLRGERAGMAVAVRLDGKTSTFAFGAVPAEAIFEIGSITKPVTATLLAAMVASGEVALDDPVARYLPQGATMPEAADGAQPVTLLDLATHSAGLPRLPVNLDVPDESDPYSTFTIEDLFGGLSSTPLRDRGTVAYSNLGYALLGQLLARASGSSYGTLVRQRVLSPLGMTDASVGPDPDVEDRRVPGHNDGAVVPHWTGDAIAPAGRVEASVADVLSFADAHASASPRSWLATTHIRRLAHGNDTHIGLAWIIVETPWGDVLWHNGGTAGFRSFVGFHPGTGTSVAVLSNAGDGEGPDAAAAAVLGSLIGGAHRS